MARDSGIGGFIAGVVFVLVVANAISDGFKLHFWFALGIVVALYASIAAILLGAVSIATAIKRRKRCAHGVKRGKEGGCQHCLLEEQRRQEEWKAYQLVLQRKKEIEQRAVALRASELNALRKKWLSRTEFYLEMSPHRFEDAIAELFRELGYEVKQTPYSNDRGKDAIAWKDGKKYLIECKRYDADNTIGRRELQIFVAAMKEEKAQGGFYINTGRFAKTTLEYAAQEQIELYDGAALPALVNSAYPVKEDISTAAVVCLDCGDIQRLPVADSPTSGLCANGHPIINNLTTTQIHGASFVRPVAPAPDPVCDLCGSRMRPLSGRRGRFWGCSKYPKCRFTRAR